MYHINQAGSIILTGTNTVVPVWDSNNHLTIDYNQFLSSGGHVDEGATDEVDSDFIKNSIDSEIQGILDATAKLFGYDSMDRAVSYVNSKNQTWKEEAEVLSEFRDSVWEAVVQYITVHGYPSEKLSTAQLMQLLPAVPVPWTTPL